MNKDGIILEIPKGVDLKGNELLIFAIIHGKTNRFARWFYGDLNYISTWANTTKNTACSVLKHLVQKGYLRKEEFTQKGIKYCKYQSIYGK